MTEPTPGLRVCICGLAIEWEPDEPTQQQPKWRHVDQAAYYRQINGPCRVPSTRHKQHRAEPAGDADAR